MLDEENAWEIGVNVGFCRLVEMVDSELVDAVSMENAVRDSIMDEDGASLEIRLVISVPELSLGYDDDNGAEVVSSPLKILLSVGTGNTVDLEDVA